jgi:hypothetical protein
MRYLLSIILIASGFNSWSQTTIIRQDQQIKTMVEEVSSQNIESIVRKLVSFQTRHSMSDTLSATTGIGAARNWIKSELERYSAASGGRLKVEFDTFTQPADGRRVVTPMVMKNVLGILPGTDPADDRVFIVSTAGNYAVSNLGDFV